MKKISALLVILVTALPAVAHDDFGPFPIEGAQVVPGPGTYRVSTGSGTIRVRVHDHTPLVGDDAELTWWLENLVTEAEIIKIHIHGPAAPGENNPDHQVEIWQAPAYDPGDEFPDDLADALTGEAEITDAQLRDLYAGRYYVNVHTNGVVPDDPGSPYTAWEHGEIRGQISIDGDEGCDPGYWKNNASKWDASAWEDYSPDDSFSSAFGVVIEVRTGGKKDGTISDPTLLQALNANGGGVNALARQAVAALLNSANEHIAYALPARLVVVDVQGALAGGPGTINEVKDQLEEYNEAGCPIDQRGEPIHGHDEPH